MGCLSGDRRRVSTVSKSSERLASFIQCRQKLHTCAVLAENLVKKPVFGCQDCGQCILSYTAFTCTMRCPKQMRNGPCGGTREDGRCEAYPERWCIWYLITSRARRLGRMKKLRKLQKPVDRRLEHTSAWLNVFTGRIDPPSWGKE
jgi:methylenetetrahydrofolate reductase (NADPH)